MLLLILREEIICVVILLFLIFYYCTNKVKDKEMFFLKMAGVALVYVFLDIATVITVNMRDVIPEFVNRGLHIAFYIVGILFAIWFYLYIVNLTARYRYVHLLKGGGYLLLVFFSLVVLFLPMEYVDGRGTSYSYGPLAFLGYGIFLLYCTVCVVLLLVSRKHLDQKVRRALFPMLGIMYTAVILQSAIPELLMSGGNATLICIGLFVALDNPDKDFMKQALWDFPTGLRNRNSYNRDYSKYTQRRSGKVIGFLVADMNYLKAVNDRYGHAEGDRLIAGAAEVLRSHLKSAENVYRVGGDEFVAIYLSPDERTVAAEMAGVSAACEAATEYAVPLSIAMGFAAGPVDEHVDALFQVADERMYEQKRRMKEAAPHLAVR